jgi:membrane protein implicated in regulation of membrane protease activity
VLGNLYLISLVLGGLLLAASLVGDLLDMDGFGDTDPGDLHILTLRGVTYFLFVFGAIGTGLTRLTGTPTLATLAIALTAGVGTAALVDRVFGYLRRTDSGTVESDRTLHGLTAEVIVPMATGRLGKISVRRSGERLELLARPFDDREGDPGQWKDVRIIDIRDGTALVSPTTDESHILPEEA